MSLQQVATLGKSGVSVGYYDTEEAAARAYDRAAIGLLGRDSEAITTNFPLKDYANEAVPELSGKSREEVKNTLKNERAKVSSLKPMSDVAQQLSKGQPTKQLAADQSGQSVQLVAL